MKWLIVIIFSAFLNSSVYAQEMHYSVAQNVPLLTYKNELRLSVATGTETYGIQVAYAFSKSLAVTGSYSNGLDFGDGSGNSGDVYFSGFRSSGELALGYFKEFKDSTIIEIYGGLERYHGDFEPWSSKQAGTLPSDTVRTNCTEPFVQFDLGFKNNGHHSFSLSCKFGYLIYDHFYTYHIEPYGGPQTTKNQESTSLNIVPCITYRLGGRRLSFQAQAGLSTAPAVSYYDTGGDFFLNVGLSLRLFGEKKTPN